MKLTSTSGYAKLDHLGITDWQLLGTERRPDDVASKVLYQEFPAERGAVRYRPWSLVTGLNYFQEEAHRRRGISLNRRGTSTFSRRGRRAERQRRRRSVHHGGERRVPEVELLRLVQQRDVARHEEAEPHRRCASRLRRKGRSARPVTPRRTSVPAPGTTETTVNADDSWSEIDWRGTVDYHITDNFMSYVTASKAYRAGQYTINILPNVRGRCRVTTFIEPRCRRRK